VKTVVHFQRSLEQRTLILIRGGAGNLLNPSTYSLVQWSYNNMGAPRGGRRKLWVGCGHQVHGAVSNRERKRRCCWHAGNASPEDECSLEGVVEEVAVCGREHRIVGSRDGEVDTGVG